MTAQRGGGFSGPVMLDTGGVPAYSRRERSIRDFCHATLAAGYRLVLPTVVYAQAERGENRRSGAPHHLAELLANCEIATLSLETARQAGWLLRDSGTTDVVDAVVIAEAIIRPNVGILTSDWGDLQRLLDASPDRLRRGIRILRV